MKLHLEPIPRMEFCTMCLQKIFEKVFLTSFVAVAMCGLAWCDASANGDESFPQKTIERTDDDDAPDGIRLAFEGATLDQIIEFFSRESGLPVVRETDVPQATFTYRAPETYTMEEALRVLNILLQTQGVMLRVSDDMLYLQKLEDMVHEDLPTYQGEVPAEVTNDQIVVNVVPLQNALAGTLVEPLKTMIASYGSVTAMPSQNSLVIVETAGKIRQLQRIIEKLDAEDPQGIIQIFKIQYVKVTDLMVPLQALLAERVQKFIIDQKGNQQKVEESELRGLTISQDERTNSIIAKGMQSKIDELGKAIELLDVPTTGGAQRMMRTFVLLILSPTDVVQKLNVLYEKLPEEERPTILPLDNSGKITVIGSAGAIAEASVLIEEIDGGGVDADDSHPGTLTVSVFPLEHATPEAIVQAMNSLLNQRQRALTKLLPGQDGESLIVSGPVSDVEAVASLITILDQPTKVDRDVRLLRLTSIDPQKTLDRAMELYDKQRDPNDPADAITLEFDPGSRMATLVGTKSALDQFADMLRMVETNAVIDRERREFTIQNEKPSTITQPLAAMTRQMLERPSGSPGFLGSPFVEPILTPIDELDLLIVTAVPEQFSVIENLIATLDRTDPAEFQFRIVSLSGIDDVKSLTARADEMFIRLTRGFDAGEIEHPQAEFDDLTGNLMLSGRSEAIALYERAISEARQLLPPARVGRMIELKFAKAADVVAPLQELLATTQPTTGPRAIPKPAITVIDHTNSLYIVAEDAQHQMIARYVSDLDQIEPQDLPPMRLLQVRAADATQIATMLRQRYEQRPQEQRREEPVTVDADAATNTLIVTAADALYEEIRGFVESVNDADASTAERETRLFPLKRARASDLATALDKLYPQPPMPVDRRGRPLPDLREPKEVFVSANESTNTLIVEAPAERMSSFEKLVDQLDRVQLPPQAELRTYHVERGNLDQIARTLNQLKDQLVRRPEDGSNPVQVMIQSEPESRTLIVAGDDTTFAKVEEMLHDLQAVPVPRELRVIEVARADPEKLAEQAKTMYASITADDPDIGEVEVEVDRGNGTLLVVAEPEAMLTFMAVVNQLQDSLGPIPDVRLLSLEYANATEVVAFLEDLAANEIVAVTGGAAHGPSYFAMDRLNAILVAAGSEQHAIIKSIVDNLDKQESQEMPPLRILQLRTADAANFAKALMAQYSQRPAEERRLKPVNISADPNTNALIIAAHPSLLPEIQAIVNDLNDVNQMDAEGREIRIFPLKIARAEELGRVIDEMYPDPEPLYDRRGNPIPGSKQPREVVVRADPQTNSLIVDATIQRMAGFEKLVEQLDRQKLEVDTEIRTYRVVHADLDALATSITQLAKAGSLGGTDRQSQITVTVEPVSQTLVVSGPTEIYAKLEGVLDALDVKRPGPATSLRFFHLEHSRAEVVAEMLREILIARLDDEVPEAGADPESLLNVSTDRKTNMLIISAPDALMPVAEELIKQLDDPTVSAIDDPIVRVRPLTFASAADITQSLTQALPQLISKATGDAVDVRLIPSAGSNAIILVGLETDMPQVEGLIEGLDRQQSTEAMDAVTFTLEYANAQDIAPVLQKLLTNQQKTDPRIVAQRMRSSRNQVDLTPEIQVEATGENRLLVSGTKQTVELARTIIEELDQPEESGEKIFTTFTPRNGEAITLIETVKRVIDTTRPAGRRAKLELIAEPLSGAIVVVGPKDEANQAMELLSQWDAAALTPPQVDLKIVGLRNSDAQVVALAIGPMLADPSRWPASLRRAAGAGIAISPPTVTADANLNRLLISAPKELMPIASELIAQLDQPREDQTIDVRIFNLTTAQSADVAQALSTAMATRAQTAPGEPVPSITAEPSGNSIIVSASSTQMQEIESIVQSLDQGVAADQAQVRTIFLKHARAEHVAPIIEQLLTEGNDLDITELATWMRREIMYDRFKMGAKANVRVAADVRLNAVVISATASVLDTAEQLVTQLDVASNGVDDSRIVRVLTIENADAGELRDTLDALFTEGDQTGPVPTIRLDQSSNSLIVRATHDQFDSIESIVDGIDRAAIGTSREMRTISIDPSRASATEVAETLRRMLDRRGGSSVEVISVEELMKQREEQDGEKAEGDSISRIDSAATLPGWFLIAAAVAIPPLQDVPTVDEEAEDEVGQVSDLSGVVRIAEQDANGSENRSTSIAEPDVTIAVDEETNSLIILGSPRAVERVNLLAQQIQNQIPAMPGKIRYVGLPESVDAGSTVQLIRGSLQRMTPVGGKPGDLLRRISVLADTSNNAVIVSANDVDFKIVGDLLVALTQAPMTNLVVVKVYSLEKITAERAAKSVRELIGAEERPRGRGKQTERMRRNLEIELHAQGRTIEAVFDPSLIRVTSDDHSNSLIVMGPMEAIGFVDQFVELIDQSSSQMDASMRLFTLKHAEADEIRDIVLSVVRARHSALPSEVQRTTIRPEVEADTRTNALLVTAAPEQIEDVAALLVELDIDLGSGRFALQMRELNYAVPSQAAKILEQVVIGNDQDIARETTIVPYDETGMLLVRASDDVSREIESVLEEIDRDTAKPFQLRTIVLERADAASIAETIRQLYDDRAQMAGAGRGRGQRGRRVSIVGDQTSNTLLVSASEDDFAQIAELVKEFDSEKATGKLQFKVYELNHAEAVDIARTVQELVNELTWNQGVTFFNPFGGFQGSGGSRGGGVQGTLAIRANERLNVLIASGEGDKFELVDEIVSTLDAPVAEDMERIVRLFRVRNADLATVEEVVRDMFLRTSRRQWEPIDPNEIILRVDTARRTLIASGPADELARVEELVKLIDSAETRAEQSITVLNVENAQAGNIADTLREFMEAHAQASGLPSPNAAIVANDATGTLVVSANQQDLATIRDLLLRLDQPLSENRVIEIVALKKGDAEDVARILNQQFGTRQGQGIRVTADIRTNSLIINAPKETWPPAQQMIELLDAPPPSEPMIIRTFVLTGANANEVARMLTDTLELDSDGETSGIAIKLDELEGDSIVVEGKVVADRRSNSIVWRGTPESLPIIETLIKRFDEVEAVNPLEWRILTLKYAQVYDVYWTLRSFLRGMTPEGSPEAQIDYSEPENQLLIAATADQFKQIEHLLEEIDLPREKPVTQFVKLEYADAASVREALSFFYGPLALHADSPDAVNTRIVVNKATNTLLISTAENEWENINRYIKQFDSEEFDPSLQLRVLALKYADAQSVAQAINDAFAGQVGGRDRNRNDTSRRAPSSGGDDERREPQQERAVLVEAEDWVRAGAEPITNTIIVSASRPNLKKIEAIVLELDVAEYARGPAPRLIPVINGSPAQFAESLNAIYQQGRGQGNRARQSIAIVANEASSTLIVRAAEEEFLQIQVLAEALQQEASTKGLNVHILRLTDAPAARVEAAIRDAFVAKAQQTAQPLSITSDSSANSLIVACTAGLFAEIEATVGQLDELQPAAGQGIFIIELENMDPNEATTIIQTIGLDQPQDPNSVSRLVTEPIRISPLRGRNAIIVIANPIDRDTIVGIVKALDAAPDPSIGSSEMRIVKLRNAEASAVAEILRGMMSPDNQSSGHKLAQAVQEQMRRLNITNHGVNGNDISLDLTKPIRVIVNDTMNALIVGSTPENLAALEEVIGTLDQLPIAEAVVVQMYPLENIRAEDFRRIVQDLFDQGDVLGSAPGSPVKGVPPTETGKALLGEVAMTIDERTNTIVVAGTEETVAFVEVMKMRLDSELRTGWVEPKIIMLKHADSERLAETIQAILVDGANDLPQSAPLQDQIGRIRMNQGQETQSDVFVPMARLLVRPEPQLNALVVVGTPGNVAVITELVKMFDVPEAAPDATVRIYPIRHASASRIGNTITGLFDKQVQTKTIRPEDAITVATDERTNSLIVTTSPRSFAVFESLLKALDSEVPPEFREIRRIKIENASATRLAQMIQQLMDARLERLRKVEPETADFEKVAIVADERTNSLMIAAGNDSFLVIQNLTRELDNETAFADLGIQVIPMTKANVERIAETVNQIMERRYANMPAEIKNSQQPLVLTDPRSNSLLVAANPEDFNAIKSIVERIEATPLNPAVAIHVIPLDTKRAEEMAPWLQSIMDDRLKTLGSARTDADEISIEADSASNSLIVAASDEHVEIIRNTLAALVKAEAERPEGDIEIISLARMRASDVVEIIDELYVTKENERRGAGTVLVTPDDRINALIINAPDKDVREIRNIVARLDGEVPPIFEIQTITLAAADPLEIVGLIEEVLRGPGLSGRRNAQQATVFRFITKAAEEGGVVDENMDEVEISTAIRESISLTPDRRTNSVIVSAPKDSMALIRNLIDTLDSSESSNLNMRIFNLENADAEATARILTDLFRPANREVLVPRGDQPAIADDAIEGAVSQGFGSTQLTTVPDERKQLSITVDNRTNSILVAGTPRYLDLVEEVVKSLDAKKGTERVQWVYPLKNAVAEDVARVVTQFVEEDQRKLIETLSGDQLGSANRMLERQVTIVGDQQSNTVLVSASPRFLDRVQDMVEQLDVDPPQVLIQVLLAEVTLDSGDEWGVSANLTRTEGDTDISTGFDLASTLLTGMGIPNLSVAGTDFDLMLRALQSQGRLHVLSNPSIMTANNEPALIQIGETIRVPEATQVTNGVIQSTVIEQELGVILNVTPSINPDGFVRMDINPEISSLSNRTTQISENFESPVITVRRADTVVTVYDGDTIVLGGLISDRFEIREEAVPWLSKLPILGALFRSKSEQRAKTELLIVLTPHVITSPSQVHHLTDVEINRLSLPDFVKEQIRRGRLQGTGGIFDVDGNRLDQAPIEDEYMKKEEAPNPPGRDYQ